MAPIIVDTVSKLRSLLIHIAERLRLERNQLFFVDLEGVNLGRHGSIAIMQLLMPPSPLVYLVDVHVLGDQAFQYATNDNLSLATVLASSTVFKVFFDIRRDSDALGALFGVKVAGIIDIQVLEYATRVQRYKRLSGLAACVEKDLPLVPGWSQVKDEGRRLFAPEHGGTYKVFLERPLSAKIIQYCEQDVLLMPALLAKYGSKLFRQRATQVQLIVDDRIRLSQAPDFNGDGKHMRLGPSLKPDRRFANHPTRPDVRLICSPRLPQLCYLDESASEDLVNRFGNLHVRSEAASTIDSASSVSIIATSRGVSTRGGPNPMEEDAI